MRFLFRTPHGSFRLCLGYKPFIKPSARHVPLASDSAHQRSVHLSWPLAEIRRMWLRSSCWQDFRKFRDLKISRWGHFFLDRAILENCRSWLPRVSQVRRQKPAEKFELVVRFVCPFHPAHAGLANKLKALSLKWGPSLFLELGVSLDIQVCFRSGSTPLQFALRRLRL